MSAVFPRAKPRRPSANYIMRRSLIAFAISPNRAGPLVNARSTSAIFELGMLACDTIQSTKRAPSLTVDQSKAL